MRSELQAQGEKEHHWESELSHLSAQLELSEQREIQLESDLMLSKRELEAMEEQLQNSRRMQDLAEEEVRSL